MKKFRRKRIRLVILGVMLFLPITYVGSYWAMSRRGFSMADEYDFDGFYFYLPEETDQWQRKETILRLLCFPLIHVDCWIGTGRRPASEPLWRLS